MHKVDQGMRIKASFIQGQLNVRFLIDCEIYSGNTIKDRIEFR